MKQELETLLHDARMGNGQADPNDSKTKESLCAIANDIFYGTSEECTEEVFDDYLKTCINPIDQGFSQGCKNFVSDILFYLSSKTERERRKNNLHI